MAKNIAYISAFGTVTDKYLGCREMNPTWNKVIFYNCFNQKIISLFRTISAECILAGQLFYRFVHGFDTRFRKRLGDITDTQPDNILFRMCYLEGIYLFRYVRE